MKREANVREFRRLEQAIAKSEEEAEAMRWRQAELAADAGDAGMTQVAYAEAVGMSKGHISKLVGAWRRYGAVSLRKRPRFADAYVITQGREETTRAELSRRTAERQVPTRHEDRVEMATELLTDPAVVASVLEAPTRAQLEVERGVKTRNANERARATERREQDTAARATPLSARMAAMVVKLNEWGVALAAIEDRDLDELPDGEQLDLVAGALDRLGGQVDRWRTCLRRPRLTVIEGRKRETA